MRWFKHDADANADAKLQNVLLDYGLEGYGLYWYCIELITGKVDVDNLTFQLEHDARIIARNVGSTTQKVEEMMRYFVSLGLFEDSAGKITCLKIAKRLDKSMTSNPVMRGIIGSINSKNHDSVMTNHDSIMIESETVMQEEIRLDQIRKEKEDTCVSLPPRGDQCPHKEILKIWGDIMPEMIQPRSWDGARAKDLSARWKSKDIKADSLAYWKELFEYIRESDFLMGRTSGAGREPMRLSLDWVVKASNYNKIIEGKYHA